MTNDELNAAYFGAFSYEFHSDLILLISSKCKEAVEECSVFRRERANALFPMLRRTQIDENIEVLAEDYPEIDAQVRKLGSNNCITELRRQFVVLTIHKVTDRNSKVRPAVQREMLARSSQVNMFEKNELPSDEAILYIQLKYGVARRFPKQLAFVVADFPDKDGNIVHSINLLAMPQFSSLLNESTKETRTENIDDNIDLNLRSDARNKDRRGGIIGPLNESQSNTNNIEENKDDNGDKDKDEN